MFKQRIILFAPLFYGYWKHIKDALEKQGFEVSFVTYRMGKWGDTFNSLKSPLNQEKKYADVIFERLKKLEGNWDYLIVIKGNYFTEKHLSYLKRQNPDIKTIMYQWDSINNNDYTGLASQFHKVFTFDFKDAEDCGYNYLPLFYTNDINPINPGFFEDIDLLLVGLYNKPRYEYLRRLEELKKIVNVRTYIVVPPMLYLKKQLLNNELEIKQFNDIHFTPLNRTRLINLYHRSKVFVDICQENQTGMSMRTIEAYGMNKKLLTSNKNIPQDPWVKEIQVLDSNSDDKSILSFINRPTIKYKNRIKLSIQEWVNALLS